VTARAINGVYNYSVSQTRARAADPTFYRVTDAIRHIQQEGALSVRIEKRGDQQLTYIGFRHGGNQDVEKSIRSVKEALGINPSNDEPLLVFGSLHRNPDEIALLTRSVQEILTEFSAGVEVSERDLTEGRATPLLRPDPAAGPRSYPLMRIQSSSEPSADAYAGVRYRDRWFWIDDGDWQTKRAITAIMFFFTLAETGSPEKLPLITIPAQ